MTLKKEISKLENENELQIVRYKSEKYHGVKEKVLPLINPTISFLDFMTMYRLMVLLIPSLCLIFKDVLKKDTVFQEKRTTYNQLVSSFNELFVQSKRSKMPLNPEILIQYNEECKKFKNDAYVQNMLFQEQYMEKMKNFSLKNIYDIVKDHLDLKQAIQEELKNPTGQNIDLMKRSLKKTEFRLLWKQIRKITKNNLVFSDSTTNLNNLEKEIFHHVLMDTYINVKSYSPYTVASAIISILNYPVVPYLGVIIKSFDKDKERMYLPGKEGKKRIRNPKYDDRIDDEQAYHLWLAVHSHHHQEESNHFDSTFEITKEDLFQVFIRYGSVDKAKFERIINNSVRFFEVNEDKVVVCNTRTLLDNFGYTSPPGSQYDYLPKQYHRFLPSRRLFRYMVLYTLAERDYLASGLENETDFGYIDDEKNEVVKMPHGRSYVTIAKQAKVHPDTVYRYLKRHPKKKDRIKICGVFTNLEDAISYSNEISLQNRLMEDLRERKFFSIYQQNDEQYMVTHDHSSCFYGSTWLYLSRVSGKRSNEQILPAVDQFDPLESVFFSMKRVKFKTNNTKRKKIKIKYDREERIRKSNQYKKSILFEKIRNKKLENPDYKITFEQKNQLDWLDHLILKRKRKKEILKQQHDSYKTYFLAYPEQDTLARMKKKRMITISEKNGDMTFKPKLNGKTQKYEIPHQLVPAFLKQLNMQFVLDDGRGSGIVMFNYSKYELKKKIQFDRDVLDKLRVEV